MVISEIFYSLQGEGTLLGVPSVFIRTSGCNLRCAWCDTPYASWEPEGAPQEIGSILTACSEWDGVEHVVITGGEPLIHRDLPTLVEALRARGRHVTVETAGTLYVEALRPQLFSISPKLANSVPGDGRAADRALHQRHRTLEHLPRYLQQATDYQLKFVVRREEDVADVLGLISDLAIPRDRVFLMPEAATRAELRSVGPLVAAVCVREGFRYAHRLHLDLWDNVRAR